MSRKKIASEVFKDEKETTNFDVWMFHTLKDLYEESEQYIMTGRAFEFAKKLFAVIQEIFCEDYLEITKIHHKKKTGDVAIVLL